CSAFIAAIAETTTGPRAVVNVNCLNDRVRFTSVPEVTTLRARRAKPDRRGMEQLDASDHLPLSVCLGTEIATAHTNPPARPLCRDHSIHAMSAAGKAAV